MSGEVHTLLHVCGLSCSARLPIVSGGLGLLTSIVPQFVYQLEWDRSPGRAALGAYLLCQAGALPPQLSLQIKSRAFQPIGGEYWAYGISIHEPESTSRRWNPRLLVIGMSSYSSTALTYSIIENM